MLNIHYFTFHLKYCTKILHRLLHIYGPNDMLYHNKFVDFFNEVKMKSYPLIFLQVFSCFVVQNVLAHEIELEAIVVDDDPILDSGVKPYDIITEYDFEVIKQDNISDSLENVLEFLQRNLDQMPADRSSGGKMATESD